MTEPSPSPLPATRSEGVRWLVALVAIGVVAAILAVPLLLIRGLVLERMDRGARAQAEAAGMWGGRQTVAGPILVIPYRRETTIFSDISEGFVAILPETLEASARIRPESRSKGLFDIVERRNGIATAIILAAAHGFMFVLLQSERFALLAGAAGLLIGLIAAMAATRNLDWHRLAPVGGTGASGASGGRG